MPAELKLRVLEKLMAKKKKEIVKSRLFFIFIIIFVSQSNLEGYVVCKCLCFSLRAFAIGGIQFAQR